MVDSCCVPGRQNMLSRSGSWILRPLTTRGHPLTTWTLAQHSLILTSRWRRGWQPCCELREKLCSFSYVLFVFLLFYVLDVVSITVYDRDTLLNIGSSVAQRKHRTLSSWMAGGLFNRHGIGALCVGCEIDTPPPTPKKRNTSWRSRQTETPSFPTSLFQPFYWPTFSHWITNSVNCVRAFSYQRENRDCCVICLTETWMSAMVPRLSHRAHGLLRAPLG